MVANAMWKLNQGKMALMPRGNNTQVWDLDLKPLALGRITGTPEEGWKLELYTMARVFTNRCAFRDLEEGKLMVEVMAMDKAQSLIKALCPGAALTLPELTPEEREVMPHQAELEEKIKIYGERHMINPIPIKPLHERFFQAVENNTQGMGLPTGSLLVASSEQQGGEA